MSIISIVIVFLFLIPIPYVIGTAILSKYPAYAKSVTLTLLSGLVFSWALFEIICVSLIMLDWSLNRLVIIYGGLLALVFLLAMIRSHKECASKFIEFIHGFRNISIYSGVATVLVAMQTLILFVFRYHEGDDAEYVAMATTSWMSNTLLSIDPYTGNAWTYIIFKRVISPWSLLPAFYAKISQLHPAIIFHTIYPVVFIPLAYAAYYLLAKKLFPKEKKDAPWIFLIFLSIVIMFDGFSTRMAGAVLLHRIWQGKAVCCAILLPLLFWYLIEIQGEKVHKEIFIVLAMITTAGVCASSMAVILLPLVIGVYALTTLIRERAACKVAVMLAGCIPCVIAGGIYLIFG